MSPLVVGIDAFNRSEQVQLVAKFFEAVASSDPVRASTCFTEDYTHTVCPTSLEYPILDKHGWVVFLKGVSKNFSDMQV